jgi:hypothetical protein
MPYYSATWVSLHKQLSYAKKNLSVAERQVYIVTRSNFHLLKAMQLGQSFRTWILCKLTCEEL